MRGKSKRNAAGPCFCVFNLTLRLPQCGQSLSHFMQNSCLNFINRGLIEELLSLIKIPPFSAVKLIDVFKALRNLPLVDMFSGSKERGKKRQEKLCREIS